MTKQCAFVTSFSPEGYKQYGQKFIDSFCEHNTRKDKLYVFYEKDLPVLTAPYPEVILINLWEDKEMFRFVGTWSDVPIANGVIDDKINYRYQCVKFAKKVYAYTNYPHGKASVDWWIWIDADVVVKKDLDDDFIEAVTHDDATACFLAREKWDHSECGFMAFNMRNGGEEFLTRMRTLYNSGMVFSYSQWHDSFVFDRVVQAMSVMGKGFLSLTGDAEIDEPVSNPWPRTVLGKYMDHHKGPEAKEKAYG